MKIEVFKKDKSILKQENVPYSLNDDILFFSLEGMDHTLNLLTNEFTRENNEYSIFLDVENENCEITLKKEEYYLQVQVEYAILLKNKNIYELSYLLETDDTETKIRIELEGESE